MKGVEIKRKKNVSNLFMLVIVGMLSFGFFKIIVRIFHEEKMLGTIAHVFIGACIFFVISFLLHIVIHEMGHLVFGALSGYSFSSFRIGNIAVVNHKDGLKIKKYSIAGTGGQCIMLPPDVGHEKIPYKMYLAGGSLLNLIFAILAFILFFISFGNVYFQLFCCIFALAGLFSFLGNIIPFRSAMVENDGYNLWVLSRNANARKCFHVQLMMQAKIEQGVRLSHMPAEWFDIEISEINSGLEAAVAYAACGRLVDCQEFKEAAEMIDRVLNEDMGMVGIHRNLLISERIYCELVGNRDFDLIERLQTPEFNSFAKAMNKFPSIIRTHYAIHMIMDEDFDMAEMDLKNFEIAAARYPYEVEMEGERELLQRVRDVSKELEI